MINRMTTRYIVEHFNVKPLAGEENMDREIHIYGLNRAGIELAGFHPNSGVRDRRVILLSNKENLFVQTLKSEVKMERYEQLTNEYIPLIILTDRFLDDDLIAVAAKNKCPLIRVPKYNTSRIMQILLDFQDEYFAKSEEVHASLVNVFGKGVLIEGKSGIGKSEITLELVKKNHLFVADDRVILIQKGNKLYGRSHEILQNLIEVRGLGIIDLSKIYGLQYLLNESIVDLVVELIYMDDEKFKSIDRLGNDLKYVEMIDTLVPKVIIPVTYGRNISELVETAVAKLKMELAGVYSSKVLQNRLYDNLKNGK